MVHHYATDFGPFVMLRGALEPQGRWPEFVAGFTQLCESCDRGGAGGAQIHADYLLITAEC